ncbi:MAG: cell division protein FtsQ/DivIB [Microcystaceae cyanobacterium]
MMDLIVADSLKDRRQTLRSQRQLKFWQSCWRCFVLSGSAVALLWVMSRPAWIIRDRSQVELQGNQLVPSSRLYEQLSLQFPQSLWQLSTPQLSRQLEALPAIEKAEVTRQLFPPKLIITLSERQPVAVALSSQQVRGYLDHQGNFIPANAYQGSQNRAKLPKQPLFLGYNDQYRRFWQGLYPALPTSTVKIQSINGQNPSNVTLQTSLGPVYLGSNLALFPQQLQTLNRMTQLTARVPITRVAYLDLSNPQAPALELKPAPQKTPPPSSANVKKP